jgi:hypothetical protein
MDVTLIRWFVILIWGWTEIKSYFDLIKVAVSQELNLMFWISWFLSRIRLSFITLRLVSYWVLSSLSLPIWRGRDFLSRSLHVFDFGVMHVVSALAKSNLLS